MPKTATLTKKASAKKPTAAKEELTFPTGKTRPVVYPDVTMQLCCAEDAITAVTAKRLLGWEAEPDYSARMGGTRDKPVPLPDWLLKDEVGSKVMCWNNTKNRPFDESWSRRLAQDILMRRWTGPTTMPGETVNGETIVIGRTGQVESGQHRLIALILAAQQWWQNQNRWKPYWKTEPVLESILVFGISESKEVLRTIDNVKPRTMGDVIYTSPLFQKLTDSGEKKECSRMLAKAVDHLWKRTRAGDRQGFTVLPTHGQLIEFLEAHKKLLDCIEFMFDANSQKNGRVISTLELSPGQCAAMMYMMAAGKTDGDEYRNADPPSEKKIDFALWDKAQEFWLGIARNHADFRDIRKEIGMLKDPSAEGGIGGRQVEKHGVLARAWHRYLDGQPLDELRLAYIIDADGDKHLDWDSVPDCGGVDLGEPKPKVRDSGEPAPTPEEIAAAAFAKTPEGIKAAKDAERKRLMAEANQRLKDVRRGASATDAPKPEPRPVDAEGKPPAPKLIKKAPPKPGKAPPAEANGEAPAAKKPPKPKLPPLTRKEIEAENTRKAIEADAAMAAAEPDAEEPTEEDE